MRSVVGRNVVMRRMTVLIVTVVTEQLAHSFCGNNKYNPFSIEFC